MMSKRQFEVSALTNAKVQVADFPFATHAPLPGMVHFEDIQIQLVDMPPISADFIAPGQIGTYRHADLIDMVIDLSADIEEQWQVNIDYLQSKRLITRETVMSRDEHGNSLSKPFFCLGTKVDLAGKGLLDLLRESTDYAFESLELSSADGTGLEGLPQKLFDWLQIVRVYAKPPGKPPDLKDPFTLPVGSTVHDLGRLIHRELADKLKTARCWGTNVYEGQHVQLTHVLHDRDVVELHFS